MEEKICKKCGKKRPVAKTVLVDLSELGMVGTIVYHLCEECNTQEIQKKITNEIRKEESKKNKKRIQDGGCNPL